MKKRIFLSILTLMLISPMLFNSCGDGKSSLETETETEAETTPDIPTRDENDPVYYVSPTGDDNNIGTKEYPLATLQGAQAAVRAEIAKGLTHPITVKFMEGTYKIKSSVTMDAQDSGTENYPIVYEAEGNVYFDGGATISGSDFMPIGETEKARLYDEAKDKVVYVDLTKYGLSADDWGPMCAIGTYNTAGQYDDYTICPPSCEVMVNNERQTVARYPNEGYLKTTKPVSEGDALLPLMSAVKYSDQEWWALRNPVGDVNGIDPETAARAASWATLDHVWMFGYPRFDWADMSSPVTAIDTENNSMSTKYVSIYGLREESPYYFYNVFEELDSPGEYYLDRETGMLYLYPEVDMSTAEVMISLHTDVFIRMNGTSYVTLRGFTFSGTRGGSAIDLNGSNLTVENCEIFNVAANAMQVFGTNNTVRGCLVHHTGAGGIIVQGGDRVTLTPSGNIIENNHVHHFGETNRTYSAALSVSGVGNLVRHNLLHDAPHMAIGFGGNENIFEYNEIYNVCTEADDAGAIYGGKDYTAQGNIFRYNYFHDIFSIAKTNAGVFAIYCDDAMGGSTITQNVFRNCGAVFYHGGHNMTFTGNVIIDAPEGSKYSLRLVKYEYEDDLKPGGQHVAKLDSIPWNEGIWLERYPQIAEYVSWPTNEQIYPHYATITDNVIINHKEFNISFTWAKEHRQNRIENNTVLDSIDGDLHQICTEILPATVENFEPIPFDMIGLKEE